VVVCRLARVIHEKARSAIEAGRAKGVSIIIFVHQSSFMILRNTQLALLAQIFTRLNWRVIAIALIRNSTCKLRKLLPLFVPPANAPIMTERFHLISEKFHFSRTRANIFAVSAGDTGSLLGERRAAQLLLPRQHGEFYTVLPASGRSREPALRKRRSR